jgi:putative PIN family toxin of toxin-antitoxin system
MTVLLDSGIYISALRYGGVPDKAITKSLLRDELLFCQYIADETVRIMQKKFDCVPTEISHLLSEIWQDAVRITVPGILSGVCRDPKDDFILECAVLGNADVIVTGDKDLLALGEYEGIRIVTPRQYLDME